MSKIFKNRTVIIALAVLTAALLMFSACTKNSDDDNKPTAPAATETAGTTAGTKEPTASPEQTPAEQATPTAEATPTEKPTPTPAPSPIEIVSDEPKSVRCVPSSSAQQADMQLSDSIAIQFFATAPLCGVEVICPSYSDSVGTIKFELFAWQGSYEDTIAGEALASKTFEDFSDNAYNKIECDLPAGEYILYMTTPDASQGVGIWTLPEEYDYSALYQNDSWIEGRSANHVTLFYSKTPATLQQKVSWDNIY